MSKRVVIVDFNHLAYIYRNGGYQANVTVVENGVSHTIDTTIQSGAIKAINRWSNHGANPTAVCFDSPVPVRKAYFTRNFDMPVESDKAYKGKRAPMSSDVMEAVIQTKNLLVAGGVSCYQGDNYEADDLISACVDKAKEVYPDYYIDIITNDADILPLVDDQVSVFLRSKKMTWSETPELEKKHYVQVNPDNYQMVIEGLSAYKGFNIPYNSLLLHKLLRGDSSDNISGVKKKFPPRRYNALIEELIDGGVDFNNIFRYGKCRKVFTSVSTGKEVGSDHDASDLGVRYDDPVELSNLLDTLCWYIEDEEVLTHIEKMYKGMNLNQAYTDFGPLSRIPAKVREMKPYFEGDLQEKVSHLGIHL